MGRLDDAAKAFDADLSRELQLDTIKGSEYLVASCFSEVVPRREGGFVESRSVEEVVRRCDGECVCLAG